MFSVLGSSHPKLETNQHYLSLSQAGSMYGYTRQHLALLIREKKLHAVKIGNFYYTSKRWMDDYCGGKNTGGTVNKNKVSLLHSRALAHAVFFLALTAFTLTGLLNITSDPSLSPLTTLNTLAQVSADWYSDRVADLFTLGIPFLLPNSLAQAGEILYDNVMLFSQGFTASIHSLLELSPYEL